MSRKQREQHAHRKEYELMLGALFDDKPYPWCQHGILMDLHCPLCAVSTIQPTNSVLDAALQKGEKG